jgi:XTP/dITP diphosphohydrolase
MRKLETKTIVVASHNAGKIREFAGPDRPARLRSRQVGQGAELRRARRDRHDLRGKRLHQGAGRGEGDRPAGAVGRFRAVVDALDGDPGVYTANWAETPDGTRDFAMAMQVEDAMQEGGATAATAHRPLRQRVSAWPGLTAMPNISAAKSKARLSGHRAATKGFGYDPVFLPEGFDKTFGEMSAEEKHGWKPGEADGAVAPRACLPEVRNLPGRIRPMRGHFSQT